jgi:hypothetical protein
MSSENPHADRRFYIEGNDLGYPTLFHDGSTSVGMFVVSSKVANELIAESGFTVAEIAPGKAVMSFAGVHYTDTECGTYEEIGCAFFVNKVSGKPVIPYLGTWINILRGTQPSFTWYLPVTEKSALECGIQMWGYPKTIEDIRHSRIDGRTVTTLHKDGEEILRYSVSNLGSKTLKPIAAPVYSIIEGSPHIGYLTQYFSDASYGRDGELLLSDHALVEPLRRLGLPKKPLLSGHMGKLRFSMSAPEPLPIGTPLC